MWAVQRGFEPIETLRPSIFVTLGLQFDARSVPENGSGKMYNIRLASNPTIELFLFERAFAE